MIEEWIDYFPANNSLTKPWREKKGGAWKNHSDHRNKLLLTVFLVFYQISNINIYQQKKSVYHLKGEEASQGCIRFISSSALTI